MRHYCSGIESDGSGGLMALGWRWSGVIFAFVVVLNCVIGAGLLAWPKGNMTPLVGEQDWVMSGRIFSVPIDSAGALPSVILRSPVLRLWRSWSPETGPTQGSVASVAFDPSPYLAIPFFGFPGEVKGNTISLVCVANGQSIIVADMRTNTEWSTAYLHVPDTFCPSRVQLLATINSDRFIVGIGTPYQISAPAYYAAKAFPVRGLALTLAWAWFAGLIGVLGVAWQRRFGPADALTAGFAGMGLLGLSAFFIYHFSPFYGQIATSLITVLVPAAGFATARFNRGDSRLFALAHGQKFLLWLVIAWAYVALVGAIDNGGGSWSVNAAFSPARWSSDNQIPYQFAEHMYVGTPRDQIGWGDWLASDRPPLLSGLLLLVRTAIGAVACRVNSEFVTTLYMTISIVLMSSWVLPVCRFGETIRPRNSYYLVAASAMSPFFLFNSVYVWPKLLGASYAIWVFLELIALSKSKPRRSGIILAAVCAALSILSHASNAMIFPVLGVLFVRPILRQGTLAIGLALAAMAGVLLPWQLWQTYVQPHGNALLRYALTGDFGMTDRTQPILPAAIATYLSLGVDGWIALKLQGLMIMMGSLLSSVPLHEAASFGPGVDALGHQRVVDFFGVFRAIGIPVIGLLLLPFARIVTGRRADPLTVNAALCGVGATLLSLLIFLPAPITHQLPYAGVALMLLAGASVFAAWPGARLAALATQAIYIVIVWVIHPLLSALRVEYLAMLSFGAPLLILIDLIWLMRGASRKCLPDT